MTERSISLRLVGNPPAVHIRRGTDVPDLFWRELWSEWGPTSKLPGTEALVPIERFLSRRTWLPSACRRDRVGLEWDPDLVDVQRRHHLGQQQLTQVLQALTPLSPSQVAERLDGSRFTRALRNFQIRDLGHLLALPHGANFSVPGAGKTTVGYAVYEAERRAGRVQRLLVVAPLSAFDAWETDAIDCFASDGSRPQVGSFTDSVPAGTEVLLVNYQRLQSNYERVAAWVAAAPTMVLLDEAHRMKRGWTGSWGSACLNLAFLGVRRDILSGTPAPQAVSDLVALIDFLWPGQALRVLPTESLRQPPPQHALGMAAEKIRPLFVRTTKKELDLPDTDRLAIEVPMERLQTAIYASLRDRYAGLLAVSPTERSDLNRMGQITMYLLEAATNPHLLSRGSTDDDDPSFRHPPLDIPPNSPLWALLQRYNQYEMPRKFEVLLQMIAENVKLERKTLIWSNFVRNISALEVHLAAYQPAVIHGGIPSRVSVPNAPRVREDELARFREDAACWVLIANPAAMSEGVSLHQVCHDAIYLERTFNAGQYLQSVDRIHRLGLSKTTETRIRFLVSVGTIDEVVSARIKTKATQLGLLMDDPDLVTMALPGEDDVAPAVDSYEDLNALFQHLRGPSGDQGTAR